MARNMVQFQKGLSEPDFERQYGSEEQCRAVVVALRWPDGFVCPGCAGRKHSLVKSRLLFQCSTCRKQTSLIAGTSFASTKRPLTIWFRAIYHLTQSKQGMSSIELGHRLGVTQTTAWKIKHKLGQVMLERDAKKQLSGRIEIDDAYIGGERSGGKRGRGAAGKTPFVAAVETMPDGITTDADPKAPSRTGARNRKVFDPKGQIPGETEYAYEPQCRVRSMS
jgi:transposase-like protein